jgi:hypothetical protein
MAVASTPRNYLINVYRVRDNLFPFDCEEEFCTFRDTLKAAIWAESAQHGIDRELVIKDLSYRRNGDSPGGLGIMYCLTPTWQNRILHLIVTIGLGIHVIETGPVLEGGLCMSFRKPQFGPQNIAELLEAIFTCNGLEGLERCGSREERTDIPKVGRPFKVCTVNCPADVLEFARQRDYHVDGPDGSIYFYGKEVNRRKVEAAEAKRRHDDAASAAAALAPPVVPGAQGMGHGSEDPEDHDLRALPEHRILVLLFLEVKNTNVL